MKAVRIVSQSDEMFIDRVEAGKLLGQELKKLKGKNAVVLGIPRGGIIVAREIARMLDADLDIVLARKVGFPGNPELAIGSVSEDGKLFLHETLLSQMYVNEEYIQQEKAHQLAEVSRRISRYRRILPKVKLEGRPVIVTDDGLATGATMQAALWAARQEKPLKLIAALPVGPEEALRGLDADEIVCLRAPLSFMAVGQFYLQFDQVEDEEVLEILKEAYDKEKNK
jgi:predicted phosphoribosyltransferase